DAEARRPERVGAVEQIVGDMGGNIRDHQNQLEEGADENNGDSFLEIDADVEDQQWNHGADGQVTDEVDNRLDQRFKDLQAAHENAKRNRQQRRDDPARDDDREAGDRVLPQLARFDHVRAGGHDLRGRGQEKAWLDDAPVTQ